MGNQTAILDCSCEHAFQDKTYGRRKRVHNSTHESQTRIKGYRCTVCGRETTDGK